MAVSTLGKSFSFDKQSYVKYVLNIIKSPDLILTQKKFFLVVSPLSIAKSPYGQGKERAYIYYKWKYTEGNQLRGLEEMGSS